MKKLLTLTLLAASLALSACSQTANTSGGTKQESAEELTVTIMAPEKVPLNQETVLKVEVKQGQEPVKDAGDIQFEIWNVKNVDTAVNVVAAYEDKGVYSVKNTFKEDGIYFVRTHVIARNQHIMPKQRIIAGSVSDEEIKTFEENTKKK